MVSHESALDLLGLSDVTPSAVHLTVSRARRNVPSIPGVKIHTHGPGVEATGRTADHKTRHCVVNRKLSPLYRWPSATKIFGYFSISPILAAGTGSLNKKPCAA